MKTNSKEVKQKIYNHIADYFNDLEYEGCTTLQEKIKKQIDYMRIYKEPLNQTALRLAQGGSFIIYTYAIIEFIESLNLNNKSNKKFNDYETETLYFNLVARGIVDIYEGDE